MCTKWRNWASEQIKLTCTCRSWVKDLFVEHWECEKEDEEENRKRQLEEDKEESEGKRAKIMPTVEGHENLDFLSPCKKAAADQEEHNKKLKEQQK